MRFKAPRPRFAVADDRQGDRKAVSRTVNFEADLIDRYRKLPLVYHFDCDPGICRQRSDGVGDLGCDAKANFLPAKRTYLAANTENGAYGCQSERRPVLRREAAQVQIVFGFASANNPAAAQSNNSRPLAGRA